MTTTDSDAASADADVASSSAMSVRGAIRPQLYPIAEPPTLPAIRACTLRSCRGSRDPCTADTRRARPSRLCSSLDRRALPYLDIPDTHVNFGKAPSLSSIYAAPIFIMTHAHSPSTTTK